MEGFVEKLDAPRGGSDSALEPVAGHAHARAHGAFVVHSAAGRIERRDDVLDVDVASLDVVEVAVVALADN